MPVLNEITGLQAILPRIRREWCDQILMVDGGSSDGSLEYARQCGCETYVQRRTGIRFAYIEAWPLIRGDIVITLGAGNIWQQGEALVRMLGGAV